jgi:hypothetical protein
MPGEALSFSDNRQPPSGKSSQTGSSLGEVSSNRLGSFSEGVSSKRLGTGEGESLSGLSGGGVEDILLSCCGRDVGGNGDDDELQACRT